VYEIRILDTALVWVDVAEDFKSLRWKRRWQAAGEFHMVINRYSKSAQHLAKGRILHIRRNGAHEAAGIIRRIARSIDEGGRVTDDLEVTGNTLDGLLARRICLPPAGVAYDERTGVAETVMKGFVNANLVNPTDPARKMPGFVLAADQARGAAITERMRYNPLPESLLLCALAGGNLGWEVTLANSQYVFDVLQGVDRSSTQNLVPPIIFSPDFDNIRMMSYENSDIGLANVGYVAGQGEGAARSTVLVPETKVTKAETTQADFQTGTLVDTVATAAGDLVLKNNPALSFDGVDDYVGIADAAKLNVDYITMEAWVYVADYAFVSSHAIIMNKENSYEWGIEKTTGKLMAAIQPNWAWLGSMVVPTGQWNHVAVTWDGTNLKLYLNGTEEIITPTNAGVISDTTNGLGIGARGLATNGASGANSYFKGQMDEVRLWNNARTAAEISSDKNKELTGTEAGLVGYWKLNEAAGTNCADSSTTPSNGTIYGATWTTNSFRYMVTGTRTAPAVDLTPAGTAVQSIITWNATTPANTTLVVDTSLDGGANWSPANNGAAIPGITTGMDLKGKSLLVRVTETTTDTTVTPQLHDITVDVTGISDARGVGITRLETFIDARDLATTDQLKQRGQAKLAGNNVEERLEAEILAIAGFRYRDDWDLGDQVTLRNLEWGVTQHKSIAEVSVVLEDGVDEQIVVTFGAPWKGLLDTIKKEIADTGPSMRI
jgi:hypothetical protein